MHREHHALAQLDRHVGRQASGPDRPLVPGGAGLGDSHGWAVLPNEVSQKELGVQAASLCSHCPTKSDVRDAVANLLTREVDISSFADGDWSNGCGSGPLLPHRAGRRQATLISVATKYLVIGAAEIGAAEIDVDSFDVELDCLITGLEPQHPRR